MLSKYFLGPDSTGRVKASSSINGIRGYCIVNDALKANCGINYSPNGVVKIPFEDIQGKTYKKCVGDLIKSPRYAKVCKRNKLPDEVEETPDKEEDTPDEEEDTSDNEEETPDEEEDSVWGGYNWLIPVILIALIFGIGIYMVSGDDRPRRRSRSNKPRRRYRNNRPRRRN